MELTEELLKILPSRTVFAAGIIENGPGEDQIFMVDNQIGKPLLWIAKTGAIGDWTIYLHWAENGFEYAINNGDKPKDPRNIRKLITCSDQVFKLFRI